MIKQSLPSVNTIHSVVQTIIIILGQCSLPNGLPHPFMIDRVNRAYALLKQYQLDIQTTYFIVSGSDVSNQVYQIKQNQLHKSQAQLMRDLLIQLQSQNGLKRVGNDLNINQHIIVQDQSKSTIQNFYHCLKIIKKWKVDLTLKNIFIVTSDFHIKRTKLNFEGMFFNQQRQIIGNHNTFEYQKQVHFIPSKTSWINKDQEKEKQEKQQLLIQDSRLKQYLKRVSSKMWIEMQKQKLIEN